MSAIYGILGISDTDRAYVNTLGQQLVFDAVSNLLDEYSIDLAAAQRVFIERETENYKFRYKLPGGGRMQRRGGQAQSGAVKANGGWDIALPLEDFGDQVASSDIAIAYMSIQELDRHLDTIMIRNTNTVRYEILRSLFRNDARSFEDDHWGTLTVQPLANGDSVVYPPIMGSMNEATEQLYIESGYLLATISDVNNPLPTMRNKLESHYGATQGGSAIVVFFNETATAKFEALADFEPVPDNFLMMGDNANIPVNLPDVPGRIVGRCNGVWCVEWRWMPTNYLFGLHLEAPKPLLMRVDPASTGLGRGLQLVARNATYPFEQAFYRHRFGLGVGNRLNGVVMELGNGGSYTIPTGY